MPDMVVDIEEILGNREREMERRARRAREGARATNVRKLTKKEQQILEMANNTVLPDHYRMVWTEQDLNELVDWIVQQRMLAIDTETMGVNWLTDEIVGISLYAPHKGWYIPLKHIDDIGEEEPEPGKVVGVDFVKCLPKRLVAEKLKPLLENPNRKLLLHNAKFDMHILRHWMNIRITPYFDTMVAAAVLDENQSKALKDLAPYYLKVEADKFSTLFGNVTFDKVPILMNPHTRTGNLAGYYATKDTELTWRMYEFFIRAFERPNLERVKALFFEVEMPFISIVADAEARGVKLDKEYLEKEIAAKLHQEVEELRQKIWSYTGEINLNSPAQLAEALYVRLRLPRVNKDKPDSTDKRTLKKLKGEHEVIELLLAYREKVKLVTAFADKLPKSAVNGRVHTSFNTIGAKSGRMSSNNPNLQQIPNGGNIRSAFVADEGRLLASIDFSQQELRVLAHVSQDQTLLDIYRRGLDVHSMTAVGMWNRKNPDRQLTYEQFEAVRGLIGVITDADGNFDASRVNDERLQPLKDAGYSDVSEETLIQLVELGKQLEKTRKMAKVVNFGIIYGMQAPKLADTLEIPLEEAEAYVASYFDNYPGVKRWMAEQRKKMDEVMYTETLLGRKRRVYPEMRSGKWWLIERAYRMGINSVIQGSSADMVKLASIKLQPLLKELDAHIVLWVHDEIIFDVPENIGMENLRRIADVMCNALPLDCGLKSDIEVGRRWSQKMSEDDIQALFEEEDDAA